MPRPERRPYAGVPVQALLRRIHDRVLPTSRRRLQRIDELVSRTMERELESKERILHPGEWRRAGERFQYLTELRQHADAAGVKVRVEEQHGDPAVLIVPWDARRTGLISKKP